MEVIGDPGVVIFVYNLGWILRGLGKCKLGFVWIIEKLEGGWNRGEGGVKIQEKKYLGSCGSFSFLKKFIVFFLSMVVECTHFLKLFMQNNKIKISKEKVLAMR